MPEPIHIYYQQPGKHHRGDLAHGTERLKWIVVSYQNTQTMLQKSAKFSRAAIFRWSMNFLVIVFDQQLC